MIGCLPSGTANGDHRIQGCTLLEIVSHDRIAPQFGWVVEVAKQMSGGYLDRFTRFCPRHDARTFSGSCRQNPLQNWPIPMVR